LAAAVVVLAGTPAVAAAASTPSPAALFKALLAHPIKRAGLPAGVTPVGQKGFRGGPPAHAYGVVSIAFQTAWSSTYWGIEYDIFPTRSAAVAHFTDTLKSHPELRRPAPGLGSASAIAFLGGGARGCEIYVELVSANVYAHVYTAFEASQCQQDRARLLKVARAAVDHLRAVEATLKKR
jgi:hypothetical protein